MIRLKSIFFTLVISIVSLDVLFAQPIPPTPQSPLGEGIVFLLMAGVFYVFIRKVKDRKEGY